MAFIKEHRRGDRVYYELVEGYRDKNGKVRHRRLKWLGTTKTVPPDPIPLKGVDFADLAVKLMEESLTADDVFTLLQRIGKKPTDVEGLEAVGIRFDLAQKKLWLCLLPEGFEWEVAPPRAPPANKGSAGKEQTKGSASSRSKAKRN